MWTFTKYQLRKIEEISNKPASTLKKFFTQPLAVIGLIIFASLVICSIVIPELANDPNELNPSQRHLSYGIDGFILGTDFMGRDIWSRLWGGFGLSLKIATLTVLANVVVGIIIGLMMGYSKTFYSIVNGFIKVISSIPSILYMVLIALILTPSIFSIAFGLSITGWMGMARQVASRVRIEKTRDFVIASNALATPWYKIAFSLLVFAIPIILTQMVFTIAGAITADSALALIGLKIIGKPTLGGVLVEGQRFFVIFPHELVSPITLIFITKLSIILMGNGVTEAQKRGR